MATVERTTIRIASGKWQLRCSSTDVLHVCTIDNEINVWYRRDAEAEAGPGCHVVLVPDGGTIPTEGVYAGTLVLYAGTVVLHVFLQTEAP